MNITWDEIIYSAWRKPKFWIPRGELLSEVMEPSIVYLAPADANQKLLQERISVCSDQTS